MSQNEKTPSHLKLRQSSVDENKLVNDRGDSVKKTGNNTYNVNGDTCHGLKSVTDKVAKWGKS